MDNTTHLRDAKVEVERLLRLHVEGCDDDGHQSEECVHCGDSWPCESHIGMTKILELLGGHEHTPEVATDGVLICSECATPIPLWTKFRNRNTREIVYAVLLTEELISDPRPLSVSGQVRFDKEQMLAIVATADREDAGRPGNWIVLRRNGYFFCDPLTFRVAWVSVE